MLKTIRALSVSENNDEIREYLNEFLPEADLGRTNKTESVEIIVNKELKHLSRQCETGFSVNQKRPFNRT